VTTIQHDEQRAQASVGLAVGAALVSLSAVGGAVALIGGAIRFPDDIADRLPFASPVLAGVALALWVALPFGTLAVLAARGDRRTAAMSVVAGVAVIAWIVVQLLIIRAFSGFQPFYLVVGLLFVRAGIRQRPRTHVEQPGNAIR
jgi:hypothetical protein